MNRNLLDRVVLPIGIPLVAVVLVELFVVSLSRVLLTAGQTPAVFIATGAALGILLGSAALAASPRIRTTSILGLLTILGIGLIAVGAWAGARGYAPLEHEAGAGAEDHATPGPEDEEAGAFEITGKNIQFDKAELTFPAGEEVRLAFHNEDEGIPHNVAVYESDAAQNDLFVGEIFNGTETKTYEIGPLEAGTYFFQCDVHPDSMTGTLTVE